MLRHVLRNSLIPIITLWGLDFGAVIGGGAILTETVFDLQGVGQYAAESIDQLDVPPVLAITMFGAFFIVLLNTMVDILYAALDPRVRLTRGRPGWPLLEVQDLRGLVRAPRRASCRPSTACRSRSAGRGRSRSWASPAAASRSPRMTLLGLTRSPNARFDGRDRLRGHRPAAAPATSELRKVRGAEIAMIFQDPMTSLNPVQRVGNQIVEQIQAHEDVPTQQARERAVELLERVGIPRARGAGRQLPARVLRRHAPARDDRDGALVQPRRS